MVNLDNLFLRIKELGILAKKVSDDTGISNGNISDWKNGRSMPTAIKLDILANYLDCSVDYLLGRTDNISVYEPFTSQSEVLQPILNEDEQDILRIYRSLTRRDKHEFMTMIYNYETRDTNKKEIPKSKNKSMVG